MCEMSPEKSGCRVPRAYRRAIRALCLLLPLCLCLVGASVGGAAERILLMDVTAEVAPDSLLTVTERIAFVAEGVEIRRGLIRSIPVRRGREAFRAVSATLDGKPVYFETERRGGNMEIALGDDTLLKKGRHEYVLTYTLTNQIIPHDDGDELHWNVTGDAWIFPIERAVFRVRLPQGAEIFEYDGAVGARGAREKSWRRRGDGAFETTRKLARGEGFTVTATWTKGFVTTASGKWRDALAGDRLRQLYYGFCGAVVLWFALCWLFIGRDPRRGVIIPRFEAPHGFEPGYVGYIRNLRYDAGEFASDLIDLAVRGFVTLAPRSGYVTVARTEKEWGAELSYPHRTLLEILFPRAAGREANLGGGEGDGSSALSTFTRSAVSRMARTYGVGRHAKEAGRPVLWKRNLLPVVLGGLFYIPIFWLLHCMGDETLFVFMAALCFSILFVGNAAFSIGRTIVEIVRRAHSHNRMGTVFALLLSGLFVVLLLAFGAPILYGLLSDLATGQDPALAWPGAIAAFATIFFASFMPSRTREGRRLLDEAKGFELYLKTAEKHRLEMLYPDVRGRIPEVSRETFERFLPYAFALGVAETWADGFAELLRTTDYSPAWYRGTGSGFDLRAMQTGMSGMRNAMRSPASSASGTSSGRGGGTSSGGGGGGGGGRGR